MSETVSRKRSTEETATYSVPMGAGTVSAEPGSDDHLLAEAVEYMLADCSFAVGQTIGMRTTVDYDAIVWWHDHFREKFLAAIRRHGNRWLQDRENVTAIGWMLGERALRHAAGRASIDVEVARRAAADVQRYCEARSKRAARTLVRDAEPDRLAGYWCIGW